MMQSTAKDVIISPHATRSSHGRSTAKERSRYQQLHGQVCRPIETTAGKSWFNRGATRGKKRYSGNDALQMGILYANPRHRPVSRTRHSSQSQNTEPASGRLKILSIAKIYLPNSTLYSLTPFALLGNMLITPLITSGAQCQEVA